MSPEVASALLVQKSPLSYPEAARSAGIQGPVVLGVVTSVSGDVQEVSVISGDPALAQAAADAVEKWKYKPYLIDGVPVEMESQITIGFHLTPRSQPEPPPLGRFSGNAYSNEYFGIFYPLSRDWVLETDLMRNRAKAAGNTSGPPILLAALHIPQDSAPARADSSFVVFASARSGTPPQDCQQNFEALANEIQSKKEGRQKGDAGQFTVAGHEFVRRDFEFRSGMDHRTFVCTPGKDYLLQWSIAGWSKEAVETAVSTLQSITSVAPSPAPAPSADPGTSQNLPTRVRVSQGVSTGLLIKKVQPIYPEDARHDRIQGTVVLAAEINKSGDIADLELVSGPIELAVSAVNAVRRWKYRPYLLKGEPVAVHTQIVVNYTLSY